MIPPLAFHAAQALLTIVVGVMVYRQLRPKLQDLRGVSHALRHKQQRLEQKLDKVLERQRATSVSQRPSVPPQTATLSSPPAAHEVARGLKLTLDTGTNVLTQTAADGSATTLPLFSKEAFEALSDQWIRVGWGMRYWYSLTWLGRPILALPDDLLRMQEVVYALQPDFIVETGVAQGGSLVFYAGLFEAIGKGRIIGIDIKILPEDRQAIESHRLANRIEMIEASSIDPAIVSEVKRRIPAGAKVLVVLDSDHSKAHVAAELEAYHDLVTPGSYIVATDGIMSLVHDVPGTDSPDWVWDNPKQAAKEFASAHPEFELADPPFAFNEGHITERVTYWPGAWLRKRS